MLREWMKNRKHTSNVFSCRRPSSSTIREHVGNSWSDVAAMVVNMLIRNFDKVNLKFKELLASSHFKFQIPIFITHPTAQSDSEEDDNFWQIKVGYFFYVCTSQSKLDFEDTVVLCVFPSSGRWVQISRCTGFWFDKTYKQMYFYLCK